MKHMGTPFLDASVVLLWLRFWCAFPFMFSADFIAPDCELNGLSLSSPLCGTWGKNDLSPLQAAENHAASWLCEAGVDVALPRKQ